MYEILRAFLISRHTNHLPFGTPLAMDYNIKLDEK